MAEISEVKMSLELMVDAEKNKVIFAEANNHFVDVLFSFLTLPVGTITRLLGNESRLASAWSLTSLYRGVDGLDPEFFPSQECKEMLLRPMNAAGRLCKKLKLNIDDSKPINYFCCCTSGSVHLSLFERALCSCKKAAVYEEIKLLDDDETPNTGGYEYDGVFIKTGTKFLVTDDLQVIPATSDSMHLILTDHGINEIRRLKGMTVEIGLKEITKLLELSLFSKSPLTDIFLREEKLYVPAHFLAPKHVGNVSEAPSNCQKNTIRLVYRKSDSKVLYADAKEDFIDFLVSILTLPLGTVVEFLDGNSSLTCIDNLHKSVELLYGGRWLTSDFHKSTLISPKLPPTYKCKNPLLDVQEMNAKLYYHYEGPYDDLEVWEGHLSQREICRYEYSYSSTTTWLDPRTPDHGKGAKGPCRYVKEPANFMVSDDLTVTPLSPFSTIDLLNSLRVDFSNLAQREFSVGREEALGLLKASLISSSALTTWLNLINSNSCGPKKEK